MKDLGISSTLVDPHSFGITIPPKSQGKTSRQHEPIRRFACPVGFFRLKRFCYYLSAGTAPWREAYFHCKDRNATLAVLDRNGKDRMLRKYLMGDQFTFRNENKSLLAKLERWIGGIYNWQQMAWEWGVTGEKMVFRSFGKINPGKSEQYAWHCIVLDPALKYKWNAKSCVQRKHYICEVPAGRIARRRKKTADPFAPQNQRLKPRKQGKKYPGELRRQNNRQKKDWRRDWAEQIANQQWAHGVNPGSRPPVRMRSSREKMRHHSNRTISNATAPKVAQVIPQKQEYGTFLGDGPSSAIHNQPQALSNVNDVLSQFQAKINDFAREEVLLKP
ncbi:C-type lectin domain family 10 member A [Vespula maculifrons]|uniref:C-type lectin domain family 10 member A n=1 Tax=Vespula maculifrons TaxID=7453 RepID=A0ABD2BIS8_VESMC